MQTFEEKAIDILKVQYGTLPESQIRILAEKNALVDLAKEADEAILSLKDIAAGKIRHYPDNTGDFMDLINSVSIDHLKDIIKAQKKLIGFYEGYMKSRHQFLLLHGYPDSSDDIKTGERLRARVEELSK